MHPLLLLLLMTLPAMLPAQHTFKVMSYNIRLNVASDGIHAWPHRKEGVQQLIRRHEVDLLGVQEALPDQMADLKQMLPEYEAFGIPRDTGEWGEYSAIFYRRDRFERLDGSTFWLSETPDRISIGWDAALPRIVTWAKLRDPKSGKVFFHFNTHFDHKGEMARIESAKLIVAQIDSLNPDSAPTLLTGDFNTLPDSPPYRWLLSGNDMLADAFYKSRFPRLGPASTWNGFKPTVQADRRIDYLFVDYETEVLRHHIIRDTWQGHFPSDHLPVMAEVWIAPEMGRAHTHAHNDYEHARPLFDALSHGFTSVEVDVWLIDGRLIVAHNKPAHPDTSQTLSRLYLEPLAQRINLIGGIYPSKDPPFYLMIDIKSEAESTYQAIKQALQPYRKWVQFGKSKNPVYHVLVSGNRPVQTVLYDPDQLVALDGRPEDLGRGYPAERMPLISQRYGKILGWKGNRPIKPEEKRGLEVLAQRVHLEGKMVRLWASPENRTVWKALLDAKIDWINTDDLAGLEAFLDEFWYF